MGVLTKTKASDTPLPATSGEMSQGSSSNASEPDMDGAVSVTPETESTSLGDQSFHSETVSDLQTCDAECYCMARDKPNQPTSKLVLARTKRIQGSQARIAGSNTTHGLLCVPPDRLFSAFLV